MGRSGWLDLIQLWPQIPGDGSEQALCSEPLSSEVHPTHTIIYLANQYNTTPVQ